MTRLNSTLGTARRPTTTLDADAVRAAYRRWAGVYDSLFGVVSAAGRKRAVAAVNALPGRDVLEVGVGTGLALPQYVPGKRVTGIDLSTDMLDRARARVARLGLTNVQALHEQDAEATGFADDQFDVAVAMFVASVVPNPRRLLAEMRRVVRPGGHLLFVNHFAATGGVRLAIERAMAPASHALGWHPDFKTEALLPPEDLARATAAPIAPFGLFTLVHLPN
jgi:phosphatidylethanolamine/phosphatidyl-N-methylethanolamine N-methyltransferase